MCVNGDARQWFEYREHAIDQRLVTKTRDRFLRAEAARAATGQHDAGDPTKGDGRVHLLFFTLVKSCTQVKPRIACGQPSVVIAR